ncbi:MBL fold metallo-hydrolase [Nocardioides sp. CPCC 205120]|uniref:MBL fold metallo-hydrolase n=1 Tax=Nocardioides sp. CPCC 205120 TaxID=3406462 RepID=UPI003B511B8C
MARDTVLPDPTEVADRVWVARHPWFDANVTVVAGERGVVVVDTHAAEAVGEQLRDAVRRLAPALPLLAVVATHDHLDHVLGTAPLLDAWPDADVVAHEVTADLMATSVPAQVAAYDAPPALQAAVTGSRLALPTRTLSGAWALDLGDRLLEVVHPGRGHTGGDVCVRVPDVDVLVAGDVVEAADDPEAAVPAYGGDSWPLEWPGSLELVIGLLTPASTVVPGHGPVVDRAFVHAQQAAVAEVAGQVHDVAAAGVPADRALAEGRWPYPAHALAEAVRLGYAHLPPGARRLPMA